MKATAISFPAGSVRRLWGVAIFKFLLFRPARALKTNFSQIQECLLVFVLWPSLMCGKVTANSGPHLREPSQQLGVECELCRPRWTLSVLQPPGLKARTRFPLVYVFQALPFKRKEVRVEPLGAFRGWTGIVCLRGEIKKEKQNLKVQSSCMCCTSVSPLSNFKVQKKKKKPQQKQTCQQTKI